MVIIMLVWCTAAMSSSGSEVSDAETKRRDAEMERLLAAASGKNDDCTAASGSDDDSSDGDWHQSNGDGDEPAAARAAARAAIAATLQASGFSEEFKTWVAASDGPGGGGIQARLLDPVHGARGPEASCKSIFVRVLLDRLVASGHRTLVFSQSRVMLDILQVRMCYKTCVKICYKTCDWVGGTFVVQAAAAALFHPNNTTLSSRE